MSDKVKKYQSMPPFRAMIQKWIDGIKEHGEEFTDDPLMELYGETIDGLNYIAEEELRNRVPLETIERWRRAMLDMANEVYEEMQFQQEIGEDSPITATAEHVNKMKFLDRNGNEIQYSNTHTGYSGDLTRRMRSTTFGGDGLP